jgi:hypothetical protein
LIESGYEFDDEEELVKRAKTVLGVV